MLISSTILMWRMGLSALGMLRLGVVVMGVVWGLQLPCVCGHEFVNGLGGMLSRSCMYSFGISGFYSKYNTLFKDRQWKLNCSRISMDTDARNDCQWEEDFVNYVGGNLNFTCRGPHQYIAGLYSDFDDDMGDREWRIECCSSTDVELTVCLWTDWINTLQGELWFKAPPNKTFVGIESQFRRRKTDRIWKFRICDIVRRGH